MASSEAMRPACQARPAALSSGLAAPHEPLHGAEVAVRLLEDGRVGALLEDDLPRAGDSLDESGRDRSRAHVVPAADHERRNADLAEAFTDVPAAERPGDRPLVRALHRPVHVLGPPLAHPLELGTRLWPAVEVTG